MKNQHCNRLRQLGDNTSVCYLIGAGFSRASSFELPTAVGFLAREWKIEIPDAPACERRSKSAHSEVLDYVEKNYGALQRLNLETVLTDLHIRSAGIGRSWEEESDLLRFHYRSLVAYIRERLWVPGIGPSGCPLINRFVNCLRSQDHVLTLNYDTLLELHLEKDPQLRRLLSSSIAAISPFCLGWAQTEPNVFLSHDARRRGFFAKLHGSVDWNACPNADCPQFSSIENLSEWARDVRAPSGQYRCGTCGSFPETVIIPPVTSKAFERFPKLGIIWHRAHNCMKWSSRFVLMGVSLAESDFHLSSLLRHSLETSLLAAADSGPLQICVVNKDEQETRELAVRLRQILPAQVLVQIEREGLEIVEFASVEQYIKMSEEVDAGRRHSADDTSTSHDF